MRTIFSRDPDGFCRITRVMARFTNVTGLHSKLKLSDSTGSMGHKRRPCLPVTRRGAYGGPMDEGSGGRKIKCSRSETDVMQSEDLRQRGARCNEGGWPAETELGPKGRGQVIQRHGLGAAEESPACGQKRGPPCGGPRADSLPPRGLRAAGARRRRAPR